MLKHKVFRVDPDAWAEFRDRVRYESDPAMRSSSAVLRRFIEVYNISGAQWPMVIGTKEHDGQGAENMDSA